MDTLVPLLPIAKYLVIFVFAYCLSCLLTPIVSQLARRIGAIDTPGGRHIHTTPTPKGGGVSIYVAFHLTCVLIFFSSPEFIPISPHKTLIDVTWWISFLFASTLLVLVGMYDDLHTIKPLQKILAQTLVALILFFSGTQFEGALGIHFPFYLDIICTVLWFLIIINAFNLIDGYDGLATGIAIIASLGLGGTLVFRHLTLETLVLTAFMGGCLGFLRYNIHPAKVFLGDTGSMFLGLLLAALTLKTTSKGTAIAAIWTPLLAFGVPLFDTFLAIWRRLARKILGSLGEYSRDSKIFSADAEHIHHKLLQAGITPRNITAILYLANSLLVLCGLTALFLKDIWLAILFSTFLTCSFICVRFIARRELQDSFKVVEKSLKKLLGQ